MTPRLCETYLVKGILTWNGPFSISCHVIYVFTAAGGHERNLCALVPLFMRGKNPG
jgi:hypothetical protein